jgi:hypothetical protein
VPTDGRTVGQDEGVVGDFWDCKNSPKKSADLSEYNFLQFTT